MDGIDRVILSVLGNSKDATGDEKGLENKIQCTDSSYDNSNPSEQFTVIGKKLFLHNEENIKQEDDVLETVTQGNLCHLPDPDECGISSIQAINPDYEELISVIYKVIKEHLISFLTMCVERSLKDEDYNTLLHIAAMSGYEDVVCLLIMQGCDVAARDQKLKSALHIACEREHLEVVNCLLKQGCEKDAKDKFGRTPLHYAVEKGHRGIVETLVQSGADINALDNSGKTSLHLAAEMGNSSLVKYLISCEGLHQARCKQGLTPLECAVKMGHVNVYRVLIEYSLPMTDQTICKLACLAIRGNQMNMLKEIINSDIVSSVEDDCWKKTLKIAHSEGRHEAVAILVEKGCVGLSDGEEWNSDADEIKPDHLELLEGLLGEGNSEGREKTEAVNELYVSTDVISSPEKNGISIQIPSSSTLMESELEKSNNNFLLVPDMMEVVNSDTSDQNSCESKIKVPGVNSLSECNECHKSFSTSHALQIHLRTHSGERPYKCTHCGKTFTQSGSLLLHLRTHSGERPYECKQCGKRFSQSWGLKIHQRRHTGEHPYECDQCNKKFPVLFALQNHYITHSSVKLYKCEQCDKRFSYMSSLQTHYQMHAGIKAYECTECGKKFGKMCTLQSHLRTHSGDKPYKCDECGKRFSQSGSLRIHQRTHTGEKPYTCNICGGKFTQSGSLKNHYKRHAAKRASTNDQ